MKEATLACVNNSEKVNGKSANRVGARRVERV